MRERIIESRLFLLPVRVRTQTGPRDMVMVKHPKGHCVTCALCMSERRQMTLCPEWNETKESIKLVS